VSEAAWAAANYEAHASSTAAAGTDRNEGVGTGRPATEVVGRGAIKNHEGANTKINYRTTACSRRRLVES